MTQNSIIKRLIQKDENAFLYLMDKYSRLLWKVADDILSSTCTAEDIEECISDVYFKLWQNPKAFDDKKGSLKNYLVMMTKSHAIDIYRKKARRHEYALDESVIDSGNNPEAHLLKHESQNDLNSALDSLQSSDKEIILKRYLYNEKPLKISEDMNIPVRQVENRLYRTKQKLRNILGPKS